MATAAISTADMANDVVRARAIAENIRASLRALNIDYRDPTAIEQTDKIGKALADVPEKRAAELIRTLLNGFDTITRLGSGQRMTLYADTSPLSFAWGGNGLFGGLIFHGSHDGGGDGGPQSFSVCLSPVDGWSIHT